ncbi:MAG: hypothetical protein JXC31_03285 [Acholeplasmataceae bacterium]|nr:hypothetical protein [Acholeplasmataceae bacterium]
MKQFALILFMLSSILGIISHIFAFLDLSLTVFDRINLFSSLYIRFGGLTLIMGFIALYLSSDRHVKLKFLSLAFIILGFLHFILIEFGFLSTYGILSVLFVAFQLLILCAIILQFKNIELDALTIKGYISITTIIIYFIAYFYIALTPSCMTCSQFSFSHLILPFAYVIFQIGIYVFFLELYREIYHYKNEYYINL